MKELIRRVWHEVESGEIETMAMCGGMAVHYSRCSPSRESTPNEDSSCAVQVSPCHGVIAVADGVGGANAGNRASRVVVENLVQRVTDAGPGNGDPPQLRGAILDAIEQANREILGWGIGAGSTLAAVEIAGNRIRVFHIGDTKAMLVSNRGRIKFATVGHAPVALAVEIGMIQEDEALVHDDRNLITNCLGSDEMKIEIGPPVGMAARDTLLVASDGLFDNLTTDEISQAIRKGKLAQQTARLAELAMDRMNGNSDQGEPSNPDDLTILCFRLQ